MAGSYNHVVTAEGDLRTGDRINGMLECMSGDVVECVEEMYGMIWYLAMMHSTEQSGEPIKADVFRLIEDARVNHQQGLIYSPTKRYTRDVLDRRSW